jgi:transcriptional regulator with XRE-family HTH domain
MNLAPFEKTYKMPRMSSNEVKRALNITLGKNLRRLRLAKGLTQEQLAELAETDKRYISAMEGGRGIGSKMFSRLCRALNADSQEFVHPPDDLDDAMSAPPKEKLPQLYRDRSNEIRYVGTKKDKVQDSIVFLDEPEISIHHRFILEMFDALDDDGQNDVLAFLVKKLPKKKG